MENSLEIIKRRITAKYLGTAGIHGVGINQEKKTVKIYYDLQLSDETSEVFTKIEEEAQPYTVEKIVSNYSRLLKNITY